MNSVLLGLLKSQEGVFYVKSIENVLDVTQPEKNLKINKQKYVIKNLPTNEKQVLKWRKIMKAKYGEKYYKGFVIR